MAKYIAVDKLKPLLSGVLTAENEASFIEGVMTNSEDYDDDAIQARIDSAVEAAKAEEAANYAAKLHDMFFGGAKETTETKIIEDDTKTDREISTNSVEVEDIFE